MKLEPSFRPLTSQGTNERENVGCKIHSAGLAGFSGGRAGSYHKSPSSTEKGPAGLKRILAPTPPMNHLSSVCKTSVPSTHTSLSTRRGATAGVLPQVVEKKQTFHCERKYSALKTYVKVHHALGPDPLGRSINVCDCQ